jgi:CBS domain-containing protein
MFGTMKVREIMTPNVRCIAPETSLKEAATIMGALDVGALPICNSDRLAGMLTDRDIALRCVARGRDPEKTPAREAMTESIIFIYDDQDVGEAARLFETKQIRRLPVLNRKKRMIGIISLGDLAVNAGEVLGGEALKEVSQPSHAHVT